MHSVFLIDMEMRGGVDLALKMYRMKPCLNMLEFLGLKKNLEVGYI